MTTSEPLFSVVIPTYGKAQYLQLVLAGLERQTEQKFETIIVDNNSTEKVTKRAIPRPGQSFIVVHEPRNGLSYARNAGIRNSRGQYVAFLDDDGVPDRNWLMNLANGMGRHKASMVGGTVRLVTPHEPPWLSKKLRLLLSELLYEGQDISEIGDNLYIVGANMCVSRDAFRKAGQFSHFFDRTANSLRSSGELEFSKRVQRTGGRISFVASAIVHHHIPDYRLTRKYFLSRSYWQGRSDALLEVKWGRPASFGPRDNARNFTALMQAFGHLALARESTRRFQKLLDFAREYGYCVQYALLTLRPGAFADDV